MCSGICIRQTCVRADPSIARCTDVSDALALGCGRGSCVAALSRRQESPCLPRADGRRGSRRGCISRPARLRRKPCCEREIPDHPLVRQTIGDCLTEAMDIAGLERLLRALESGAIPRCARDLTAPSPLALEVLSARPYAFLDDALWKSAGPRPSWRGGGSRLRPPPILAGSIRKRSPACAKRPGPTLQRPMNCMTPLCGSAS